MLNVYNPTYDRIGVIEGYAYLNWTRKYTSCGEFEFKTTLSYMSLLQIGNVISKFNDSEAGIIEYIHAETLSKDEVTVTGRLLPSNLRRFTLDKKPHIKEYYRTRKMHSEIVSAMIQYHDDGRFTQKVDSGYAYEKNKPTTVYLLESDFDLDTRVGSHGFYDMLVYKPAPNMNCITEAFIQSHRYRKPEKIEFLQSMLDSKPGLFEITGTDSSEGYAYLREVFTGEEYRIIDVGLSGDANHGDFYIYTRVITYHGFSFGTGLNLLFSKTDSFIQNHIRRHKKDYSPNGEFMRFTQLYNQYSRYPDKIKVVANTLK